MNAVLTPPPLVGSRELAREFVAQLPDDLSNAEVTVDCAHVEASAPSFVDELVKIVLVEREARRLVLQAVPERTARYATRSALNRAVSDRLTVEPRDPVPA